MHRISEKDLNDLKEQLSLEPTNIDLINRLALGYYENPEFKIGNEELDYFELSYNTKKTVKSIHNLSWYLYYEYGNIDRAFQLQKECLLLNPQSYYPYVLMGNLFLDKKQYKEALPYFKKGYSVENQKLVESTLGFTYFQLHEFEKAKEWFVRSIGKEKTNPVDWFNLALAEYKCGNLHAVKSLTEQINSSITFDFLEEISGFEVGVLFFLLKDYQNATSCLIKQGIHRIDLLEWKELSYALFISDRLLWEKEIKNCIKQKKSYLIDTDKTTVDKYFSEEDKKEAINDIQSQIEKLTLLLNKGVDYPVLDLKQYAINKGGGCLLFGCESHGNLSDDQ